jgi:hypothetical protein
MLLMNGLPILPCGLSSLIVSFVVIVHQRRPSKERLPTHQPTTAQSDLLTTLTTTAWLLVGHP